MSNTINLLTRFKAWADEITFPSLLALPESEVIKDRPTNFGTILKTMNHVFVVDDIFRHHLTGQAHGYTARNTEYTPTLGDLFTAQRAMNAWYVDLAAGLSKQELGETVAFQFVGGGQGSMAREEILLHVVNHATYHRGFVNDMMYQVPARPPANDLPVFLREVAE